MNFREVFGIRVGRNISGVRWDAVIIGKSYSRVLKCDNDRFMSPREFSVSFFEVDSLYIYSSPFASFFSFSRQWVLSFLDTADLWHFTRILGFTVMFFSVWWLLETPGN